MSSTIGRSTPPVPGTQVSPAGDSACGGRTLLWHARWTLPLHVVLPIWLWWLMQHDPGQATAIVLGIHIGFPAVMLVTIRWWWRRVGELVALLILNHLVSFAVLAVFVWFWSGPGEP